jgi:hypothetical protein
VLLLLSSLIGGNNNNKQQERTAFSIPSTGLSPEMVGAGARLLAHSVVIDDLTCNHHLLFPNVWLKNGKKGRRNKWPKLSTHTHTAEE